MNRLALFTGTLCLALLSVLVAAQPVWWNAPGTDVYDDNASHDTSENYAPANLGQLKNMASKARVHLDEALFGGGGEEVDELVGGFVLQSPENYAPINLGQLKAVANPFYERLIEAGYDTRQNLRDHGAPGWAWYYPWNTDTLLPTSENYAPANLGQLKWVFSFDLTGFDTDGDGLSDRWEMAHGLDANDDDENGNGIADGLDDFDGDGFSNGREHTLGSDPTDALSGLEAVLLGRWRFNEGKGSTVTDSSGNGRDGILQGTYTWVEMDGRRYLDFPDATGYAKIEDPDFRLGDDDADFTVTFWIRLSVGQVGQWESILHKGNDDYERTFAMWMLPNTTRIHTRISGASNWNMGGDTTGGLPTQQWAHVAYVKDGSTLRLYIDGSEEGNFALGEPVVGNDGPIYLGKDPTNPGVPAAFDDLQIYDVALSAGEVTMLQESDDIDQDGDGLTDYEEARLGTDKTLPDSDWDGVSDKFELADGTDPNDWQSAAPRRVAYFPFDALDLSSDEGQLPRSGSTGEQVPGAKGRALRITSTGQRQVYDFLRASGAPNYAYRRGTVRMWFKPEWSAPQMSGIFSRLYEIGQRHNSGGAYRILHFQTNDDRITMAERDGNGHDLSVRTSAAFSWNAHTWHQLTVTYSPAGRVVYLDGALLQSNSADWIHVPEVEDILTGGIGFGNETVGGDRPLKGVLDEVEFFNYELPAAQIAADYNALAPGLVDANGNGIPDLWETTFVPDCPPPSDPGWSAWWENWKTGDPDGDGLTNWEESAFGTDPNEASSNGSGIPDGWLADHGIDPLTADAYADEDEGVGDGLSLWDEYESGTNPSKRDTDGDDVIDGEDGWALDNRLAPPRLPESKYAVIDLSAHLLQATDYALDVNDDGQVLFNYYEAAEEAQSYVLNPDGSKVNPPAYFNAVAIANKDENGHVPVANPGQLWKTGVGVIDLFPQDWHLPGIAGLFSYIVAMSDNAAYFCGVGWNSSTVYVPNGNPRYYGRTAGHVWVNGSPVLFGMTTGSDDGVPFGPGQGTMVFDINNRGDAVGLETYYGTGTNRIHFREGATGTEIYLSDEDEFADWIYINNWTDPLVGDSGLGNPAFSIRKDGVWSRKYIGYDLKPTEAVSAAMLGVLSGVNDQGVAVGNFWGLIFEEWNLWKNGRFQAFKDLLDEEEAAKWSYFSPIDINNSGVVLATAQPSAGGDSHPVLLIPVEVSCPEIYMFSGHKNDVVELCKVPGITCEWKLKTSSPAIGTFDHPTDTACSFTATSPGENTIQLLIGSNVVWEKPVEVLPIISRAAWGAYAADTSKLPTTPTLNGITFHHSSNTADGAAEVERIQDMHMQISPIYWPRPGDGWGDIGYHFLMDKSGNVYEGRQLEATPGKLDGPYTLGSHVENNNTAAGIGICVLGDYEGVEAFPAARQEALEKALTAIARRYKLKASKVSYHKARATTNPTECPGSNIIPKAPEIIKHVGDNLQ